MKDYVKLIIHPFIQKKVKELDLPDEESDALLIFDCWKVHIKESFRTWLKTTFPKYHFIFIPANCTSKIQPADIYVNKPLKDKFTSQYTEWASNQVAVQCKAGVSTELIRLSTDLGTLKPVVVKWIHTAWRSVMEKNEGIRESWDKVGFFKILDTKFQLEALKQFTTKKIVLEEELKEEEPWEPAQDSDSDTESEEESAPVALVNCVTSSSSSTSKSSRTSSRLQQTKGERMSRQIARLDQEDVLDQACYHDDE
jgi:DDE superfamily endonuclease